MDVEGVGVVVNGEFVPYEQIEEMCYVDRVKGLRVSREVVMVRKGRVDYLPCAVAKEKRCE